MKASCHGHMIRIAYFSDVKVTVIGGFLSQREILLVFGVFSDVSKNVSQYKLFTPRNFNVARMLLEFAIVWFSQAILKDSGSYLCIGYNACRVL